MTQHTACCKAGRVAAAYGITEYLDDTLGAQWEQQNGPGLRQLARQFNVEIVHAALVEAGEPALAGEAELLYTLLTDDDIQAAERARTRQRLANQNIDPEALSDAFVSYRTIDRHFKNCTDRARDRSSEPVAADDALDRIQALKRRLEQVTEQSIVSVARHTPLGPAGSDGDVIVQVTVVCPSCGDRLSPRELFDGGCRCTDASTPAADKSSTGADAPSTADTDHPSDGKSPDTGE